MKHTTLLRRQIFVSCGLSEKEAFLYDLLLAKGQAYASELEKESKMKKNTYALLRSLIRKKLAIPVGGKGKEYYQAASPDTLIALAKDQEKAAGNARSALEQILPSLTSTYAMTVGKPVVRYFEGEEGIKEVFSDIYAKKTTPVYGCVDFAKADAVFPEYIAKTLIPLRVENDVMAYSVVGDSAGGRKAKERDHLEKRQTMLVNTDNYPIPAEIDVYEDKIALLSFEKGKFLGMIIENPMFAQSLESIFKLALWKSLPQKTGEGC